MLYRSYPSFAALLADVPAIWTERRKIQDPKMEITMCLESLRGDSIEHETIVHINYRGAFQAGLDHSRPVCRKLEALGFLSARDTERMSVATHAQKHRHRHSGSRPPAGPHDILVPVAEVPEALEKLSHQMCDNPSVAGHMKKGETMQILIDDVHQVGGEAPSHRIRVVKQHQTWAGRQ